MTEYIIMWEADRNLPALFPQFSGFCKIDEEEDE